jgi:hypothetical protein
METAGAQELGALGDPVSAAQSEAQAFEVWDGIGKNRQLLP